jgi:hypothetical protein
MADKGVKLETAYIELTVDGSNVDKQIQDSLSKSDRHAKDAGKKMGKGISDGVKEGTKDLGTHVKDALNKAGTDAKAAGTKAGKSMSEGVKEGVKDGVKGAGGWLKDVLSSSDGEAREAGKKAGKEAAEGAKDGAKGAGFDIGKWIGKEIGDALASTDFGKSLRGLGDELSPIADRTHAIGDNMRGAKEHLEGFSQGKGLDGLNNKLEHTGGLVSTIVGTFQELKALNDYLAGAFGWYKDLNDTFKNNGLQQFFQGRVPMPALPQMPQFGQGFSSTPGGTGLPGMVQNLQALGAGGNKAGGLARSGLGSASAGGVPMFTPPTDGSPGGSAGGSSGFMPNDWLPGMPRRGGAAPSGSSGGGAIVPAGTYTGPDSGGKFPGWVNDLSKRFGLAPSTYSGHQTTNRAEAGFAPNPQNFNRGIDWGGPGTSPDQMQRFADFAQSHPELFEQVIWNNPNTGQTVTIAGGRLVPASYYASDLGGHRDHVHTRFAQGFSLANMPSFDKGTDGPLAEDTLAQLHKGEIVVPKDQVDAAMAGGDPNAPDGGPSRTEGYIPAAVAANAQGVAGTSSLAGLIDLGNQAAAGAIDTGASAAQMALSAMSFGAGGAAGGLGIQMGAALGKRAASYGFQALSIGADALIEQLFPFGAPRWIGYDYTQFAPNLDISQIGTTTAEKAVQAGMGQQDGGDPADGDIHGVGGAPAPMAAGQMPGGPVSPTQMPGAQASTGPTPAYGEKPPAVGGGGGLSASVFGGLGGSSGPKPEAPKPNLISPDIPSIAPLDIFGMDSGGWLPHDAMAYNSSGRPELMVPEQSLNDLTRPAVKSSSGATLQHLCYGPGSRRVA